MTVDTGDLLDLPTVGERQSLREQVAQALRGALVAGEMRPGTVYSAPALATRFGVSATPVREAMLDLAKEGLVEAVRNKGFRVVGLSDRDLYELTEIRRLIEVPTVAALADSARAADFDRLRPLAGQIASAAQRGDVLAYVNADLRFHLDLLALTGNAHLVRVSRDLWHRARLYGLRALAERGRLAESSGEDLALVEALGQGDAEATRQIMDHHIRRVRGG